MIYDDMPAGFCLALAENPEAVKRFNELDYGKKKEIINTTKTIRSKDEIRQFVNTVLDLK